MPELSKIRNTQTGVDYDIVDAQARLTKAPINNPNFTGEPTAPTQAITDNSTKLATTAFVHKRGCYHVTATIPQGTTKTFTVTGCTATMRVINCVFGTPSNVTSKVTWTTSTNSVTFAGTFTGSTTIDFDLIEADTLTAT